MKVKLSDIIEAIEFTDNFSHYFLDTTTDEVMFVNEMVMTSQEQEDVFDRLEEHGIEYENV